MASFVNLCHGLVTFVKRVVAVGEGVLAWLRGERHGVALCSVVKLAGVGESGGV